MVGWLCRSAMEMMGRFRFARLGLRCAWVNALSMGVKLDASLVYVLRGHVYVCCPSVVRFTSGSSRSTTSFWTLVLSRWHFFVIEFLLLLL
jgi:hypothetical protein